ncbi:MAG: cbb3-type cytochrome c oxidase subunit 3 [Agarilytica sp.]
MDINTLRGISTILVAIAFFAICWWAFSPRRKQKFKEAANLPFADEVHTADKTNKGDEAKNADSQEKN